MTWFDKVKSDYSNVVDMIDYYEDEIVEAKRELKVKGRLEKNSSDLPGILEHRFNQLQDIEAVLEHLNIQYRKTRSHKFKKYFENMNIGRSLSSRDCEKYVEGDDDVVTMAELVNEVAYIRNKYLGIMKGLEAKGFSINNCVKLRSVGIEDAEI